jgi:hypothetical protein
MGVVITDNNNAIKLGKVEGPQGDQGIQGVRGITGPDGPAGLNGPDGAPALTRTDVAFNGTGKGYSEILDKDGKVTIGYILFPGSTYAPLATTFNTIISVSSFSSIQTIILEITNTDDDSVVATTTIALGGIGNLFQIQNIPVTGTLPTDLTLLKFSATIGTIPTAGFMTKTSRLRIAYLEIS